MKRETWVGRGVAMEAAGVLAIAVVAAGTSVAVAEEKKPFIEAYASFELQNDWTYDSDDRDNERNDLYAKIEPTVTVNFTQGLSLTAHGVLEPVRDPEPGKDRYFGDEGFYIEDLFGQYEFSGFAVKGGKFTPDFGRAWDIAPGIYGSDFAEDYELSERIGVGASYTFEIERFGEHTLSASTFFVDTSVLSESIITKRGRTRLADGGPGNTESLESFAIALSGGKFGGLPLGDVPPGETPVEGLTYQIAMVSQAAGKGSDSRETGVVASLAHKFPVSREIVLEPLVEYAHFFDADGVDGQSRDYITAGATAIWRENWNLALSYTRRETSPASGDNIGDNLFQVSAGYEFDFGFGANVGWLLAEEGEVDDHTLGVLLTYCLNCPD